MTIRRKVVTLERMTRTSRAALAQSADLFSIATNAKRLRGDQALARGQLAGAAPRRPGFLQGAEGDAEVYVAHRQRRRRLHVAGRDVIQHDDAGANLLIAERCFLRGSPLDQLQARTNMVDQGDEVGHDLKVGVIPVAGLDLDAVACCVMHRNTPYSTFRGVLLLVR